MVGKYKTVFWSFGVVIKCMEHLSRDEAKKEFYKHYDMGDCCVEVITPKGEKLTTGKALKHFGKIKRSAFCEERKRW